MPVYSLVESKTNSLNILKNKNNITLKEKIFKVNKVFISQNNNASIEVHECLGKKSSSYFAAVNTERKNKLIKIPKEIYLDIVSDKMNILDKSDMAKLELIKKEIYKAEYKDQEIIVDIYKTSSLNREEEILRILRCTSNKLNTRDNIVEKKLKSDIDILGEYVF
ncbi:MAG: hypothetical protein ACOCP4_05220 [Candidatus Woesearchaeota archaeon]